MRDSDGPAHGPVYRDPAKFYGALVALVTAVLAALPAFGVGLSAGQEEAVFQVLSAASPFAVGLTAWLIRRKAFAPETVDRLRVDATRYAEGEDPAGV